MIALTNPLVRLGLGVLAFVALVAGFNWWLSAQRREAAQADRTATAAAVAPKVREADERAHEAAQAKSNEVEQTNVEAENAAAGSDDPLRAGLDWLRGK